MRKLSEYLMSRDFTRCIGRAAIVATAMFSINAMAVYVPIATGGEKKMLSHSLSQDGSKITMVFTHTFTNAAEVESLVFNKAATVLPFPQPRSRASPRFGTGMTVLPLHVEGLPE